MNIAEILKDAPKGTKLYSPIALEECHDALGFTNTIDADQYRKYDTECLHRLLIARDAWWEVDNGWKPDWGDGKAKYAIAVMSDKVEATLSCRFHRVLAFRTAEIRDKFLETYRDLIEKCKELI